VEGARANRNRSVVEERLKRLGEPHIAPITDLVRRIRGKIGDERVPFVDPTLGGVNARLLFLLETPSAGSPGEHDALTG
jgi:hypothetical protein